MNPQLQTTHADQHFRSVSLLPHYTYGAINKQSQENIRTRVNLNDPSKGDRSTKSNIIHEI